MRGGRRRASRSRVTGGAFRRSGVQESREGTSAAGLDARTPERLNAARVRAVAVLALARWPWRIEVVDRLARVRSRLPGAVLVLGAQELVLILRQVVAHAVAGGAELALPHPSSRRTGRRLHEVQAMRPRPESQEKAVQPAQ